MALIADYAVNDYGMTDAAIATLAEHLDRHGIRLTEDGYELCLGRLRDALSEAQLWMED